MQTLQTLSEQIATVWKCDSGRYPELAGVTDQERKNFLIKHSILHITKTAGKLAVVCENFDHTRELKEESVEECKILATKMFINALKLAEEVGVSPDELLQRAPTYIKL